MYGYAKYISTQLLSSKWLWRWKIWIVIDCKNVCMAYCIQANHSVHPCDIMVKIAWRVLHFLIHLLSLQMEIHEELCTSTSIWHTYNPSLGMSHTSTIKKLLNSPFKWHSMLFSIVITLKGKFPIVSRCYVKKVYSKSAGNLRNNGWKRWLWFKDFPPDPIFIRLFVMSTPQSIPKFDVSRSRHSANLYLSY